MLVAESVFGGTWASGPVPLELMDFELMDHFKWSWADLEGTPWYVRRYCFDLLQAKRQAEKDAHDRALEEARRGS